MPDDKKGVDRASTVIARETNEGMWPSLHCVVQLKQTNGNISRLSAPRNNELDILNFVSNVVTLWKKCQVNCKIFLQSLWGIPIINFCLFQLSVGSQDKPQSVCLIRLTLVNLFPMV